jgi:hypothetical protein
MHWPLFVNVIQLCTEELSTTIRFYLWIYDMFRPGGSPWTSSSNMWHWEVPKFTYLKCTFQVSRCYKNSETRNNMCVCGGGRVHHKIFYVNTNNLVSTIRTKYCGGIMIYDYIFLRRKMKATDLNCQRNFIIGLRNFLFRIVYYAHFMLKLWNFQRATPLGLSFPYRIARRRY